ncbi:hypothetical protein WME91_33890 [Sorangium sp. So ce269]
MNIYSAWGFRGVPFQTTALPPTAEGSRLLVGRDTELSALSRRLAAAPKIATLEGPNGIGKTSLVNVAVFRAYERYLSDGTGPLLIPCSRTFQLTPGKPTSELISDVYYEIAQTLIRNAATLKSELAAERKLLDKWLNSPLLGTVGANLSATIMGFGGGVGGTKAETANTGEGFRKAGLQRLVADWLMAIFEEPGSGGVVCVLDNLELLQTSDEARRQLEALRDELLTVPGLRWVLCGALGIVHGVASSPRLEGTLHDPIDLSGISEASVGDVLAARISAFGVVEDPYLPLGTSEFAELYELLRGNLRASLSAADEYCHFTVDFDIRPLTTDEKTKTFHEWLDRQTEKYNVAAASQVGPTAWDVFDRAVRIGGGFSPSAYADFGFNSIQALRPHVRDLEDAGLLVATREEGDRRRKTVQVTPKGWFVSRARSRA